jgi:hypothetical protein
MVPRLRDSYHPTSQSAINEFQAMLGIVLPADYMGFLLHSNGGIFHDTVMADDVTQVEELYGVNTGFDWSDLLTKARIVESVPSGYLPIGRSFTGEEIGICVSSEEFGKIRRFGGGGLLEDVMGEVDESLNLVASSFTRFMGSLSASPSDLSLTTADSETAELLFQLVEWDEIDQLKARLRVSGVRGTRDSNGATLLLHAAYLSRVEMLECLLECGEDVNAVDDNGDNAIAYAVNGGGVDSVVELGRLGAKIDAANSQGDTPLLTAIRNSQVRSAIALITLGADVNARSQAGATCDSLCISETVRQYVLPKLLDRRKA